MMSDKIDYGTVLSARYPERQWTVTGETYASIKWHDDGPVPSRATLVKAAADLVREAAEQAAEAAKLRASALEKMGITEAEARALFANGGTL